MDFKEIIVEKKDRIAWVTLNRPEVRNAINREMMAELRQAMEEIGQDDSVRVVVIRGEGKCFSAGVDLKQASQEIAGDHQRARAFVENWHNTLFSVERCPKVVIAAVHGLAFAGSLELVMACDLAIAVEDAQIGDQHMNFGMAPSGSASQRMPRLIGIRKAKELLISGDWISGSEAERLGLVNKAVPADEFDEAVLQFAIKFASKDPQAARLIKELVNWGMQTDLNTALALEKMASTGGGTMEAAMKGMAAFREKRRPEF